MNRIEYIVAWKRARKLAADIYRATGAGLFARDFGLRDQLRRAAVSVMANIAEGFGRRTKRDFASFLYVAKASAIEVVSHLYLACDLGYLEQSQFETFYRDCTEIQGMIVNFIKSLQKD